ncbi:hypothetical protein [Streptomyces humi]|uniref:hypothetical protein n=1 Tax=Streptomyces humi TaxID=1428620 RepID=UPI0006287026|nr:hypothetical protein [Streptomyces humi]
MPAGIATMVTAALLMAAPPAAAHPMPHPVLLLDVHETPVAAELDLLATLWTATTRPARRSWWFAHRS